MADTKISGLTATTSVASNDMFPLATAAGATKKITVANLRSSVARDELVRSALGLIAEPFPSGTIQGQAALTAGVAQYVVVGLFAGEVISNLYVKVSTNGSASTMFKAGIRDTSGNSVAVSSDLKASVESGSTGRIQALAVSYTVPTSGAYYLGVISVGGTPPTLGRGVNLAVSTYSATGVFAHGQEASQTDWDSTATIVGTSGAWWIGCG